MGFYWPPPPATTEIVVNWNAQANPTPQEIESRLVMVSGGTGPRQAVVQDSNADAPTLDVDVAQ